MILYLLEQLPSLCSEKRGHVSDLFQWAKRIMQRISDMQTLVNSLRQCLSQQMRSVLDDSVVIGTQIREHTTKNTVK